MSSPSKTNNPGRLRVAFLNFDLWFGGSTVFQINLAGELIKRGIPTHVYSLGEVHPLAADFAQANIPVSCEKRSGTIFEDRVLGSLGKMARFAPNVVVISPVFEVCEAVRQLPPGVFRVAVIHALTQIEIIIPYVQYFDAVVVISPFCRELMQRQAELSRVPIHEIPIGVVIPPPGVPVAEREGQPLRILYLGRLEDSAKRVRLFPEILAELKRTRIPFVWTIAGDGPERGFLEETMVSESPDQQVCFAGLVPSTQVPALLATQDVLLLVSDTEIAPLSLSEGMAAGLVPVVSDLPGLIRDLVTPEHGIRVDPSKPAGYAAAIKWLHDHRDKLGAMSGRCRHAIGAGHSVAVMTDRWLALLAEKKNGPVIWPKTWSALPTPVNCRNPLWHSYLVRQLRRWGARVRRFFPAGRGG